MMREIKFRGRDGDGIWHYGSLIATPPQEIVLIAENALRDDGLAEVLASTVGQFTGLKDCKGQEIYEGDIVERDNSYFQKTCPALPKTTIGAIEWRDGEFIVKGSYKLFPSSDKFPIRVIGNIHDNPELLEAHA